MLTIADKTDAEIDAEILRREAANTPGLEIQCLDGVRPKPID